MHAGNTDDYMAVMDLPPSESESEHDSEEEDEEVEVGIAPRCGFCDGFPFMKSLSKMRDFPENFWNFQSTICQRHISRENNAC